MRNHQDTDIGTAQVTFQPFGHFQVEVVGRLIQNDQFGVGNQNVGQCHTFQLPTGQMFHFLIEVCDLQLRKDLFGTLFIIPGFQVIHTHQDILQIGMIVTRHRFFILGNQTNRLVRRIETGLQNSQPFRIDRRLLQVADTQVVTEHDSSVIIIFLPCNDIQQSCFTRPVLCNKAHFLTLCNTKCNILKKNQIAEAFGQSVYL